MVKSFRLSVVNRYNSQKGVRYVNKRLLDLQGCRIHSTDSYLDLHVSGDVPVRKKHEILD